MCVCSGRAFSYFPAVLKLTRQERQVLTVILGLLLVGWAVRAWRLANPEPQPSAETAGEQYATD
ncbi:MAG TPA: hypothetical protein DCY13_08620 [Verrucomicrobiales bacterium]|jgi:hypothetical protein|nr:hypothetical protein [Verrucomicrobiales bacterium]